MAKTIEEIAEEIVESMSQEELKRAAKIATMMSCTIIMKLQHRLIGEQEDGKEE